MGLLYLDIPWVPITAPGAPRKHNSRSSGRTISAGRVAETWQFAASTVRYGDVKIAKENHRKTMGNGGLMMVNDG